MPRNVTLAESDLQAFEKRGGKKPKTLKLRRRFFDEFKKWSEDLAGKSL